MPFPVPPPAPFQAPRLLDEKPTYPLVSESVRITGATIPGPFGYGSSSMLAFAQNRAAVLYLGTVQQVRTDSILPRDRAPCLVLDLNGLGLLPGYYEGRLSGSFNGLPVYAVGGAGGSTIVSFSGLTQSQINSLLINLSPVQISVLANLTPCQMQTFTGLPVPQQQLLTSILTQTQITNLIDGLTVTQLTNLVGTLSAPQLQLIGSVPPPPAPSRTPVSDTNYTALLTDKLIAYTTLTAARVVTLPPANALPNGSIIGLQDESGSASATKTISFGITGSDTINGSSANVTAVDTAFEGTIAETDGVSKWTIRKYPGSSSGGSVGGFFVGNGASITNSSTEATLVGSTIVGSLSLAANFFAVGTYIRVRAYGTALSLGGAHTLDFYLTIDGTHVANVQFFNGAGAVSGDWEVIFHLYCTAAGASGSVTGHATGVAVGGQAWTSNGNTTTTKDTTATHTLDVKGKFNSGTDSVTCNGVFAETVHA